MKEVLRADALAAIRSLNVGHNISEDIVFFRYESVYRKPESIEWVQNYRATFTSLTHLYLHGFGKTINGPADAVLVEDARTMFGRPDLSVEFA